MIEVSDLRMVYQVKVRGEGVKGAVKGLFIRKTKEIQALQSVSFSIPSGKMVGIIAKANEKHETKHPQRYQSHAYATSDDF